MVSSLQQPAGHQGGEGQVDEGQVDEGQVDAEPSAQLQEIEAVGHVARRIAHNFSNMLAAALGGLALIERHLRKGAADPAMLAKYTAASMDGANRALALTQRLLEFAKEPPLQTQALDCAALITSLTEPLRGLCGSAITLDIQPAPDLWQAQLDPRRTEQALLHLARNGCDAMPDGGTLVLGSGNRIVDAETAAALEIRPGRYVVLTVTDTGTGMPPETLNRAIEPLFTTKDAGKGFGLGLTEAFRYARRARGHLILRSVSGQGTLAELFLPAVGF